MSQLGQIRKYSLRADIVRFAPGSGLNSDIAPCPGCASNGLLQRSKQRRYLFEHLIGTGEQRWRGRAPNLLEFPGMKDLRCGYPATALLYRMGKVSVLWNSKFPGMRRCLGLY